MSLIYRKGDLAVEAIPDGDRTVVRTTQEVGGLLKQAEVLRNETTGKGKSGAFKEIGELPITFVEAEARKVGKDWWRMDGHEQNLFCKNLLREHPLFRTSPGRI
jgi:hypothetical protein|tara:strand:+ start:790 stop:1101 length:312 start_codon:yes stop_codon:yes gene_type:complete